MKQEDRRRLDREARKRLMEEVMEARHLQIQNKCKRPQQVLRVLVLLRGSVVQYTGPRCSPETFFNSLSLLN